MTQIQLTDQQLTTFCPREMAEAAYITLQGTV